MGEWLGSCPSENLLVAIEWVAAWPQRRCGRFAEEIYLLLPSRIVQRFLGVTVRSLLICRDLLTHVTEFIILLPFFFFFTCFVVKYAEVGLCLLNCCYPMRNCGACGGASLIRVSIVDGSGGSCVNIRGEIATVTLYIIESLGPRITLWGGREAKILPLPGMEPCFFSPKPLCLLRSSLSLSSSYSLSYSDYLCVLFCVHSVFFHSLLCFFGFPVFIYLFLSPCSSVQHPGTWESVCLVHMSVPAGSWK